MIPSTNKLTLEDFKKDNELMFDYLDFFFNYKPHPYQKKFLISCLKKKRIAGKWSRQSGKSFTVAAYCGFRVTIQPTTIIITAPTLNQSSELYNKIKTFLMTNEVISSQIVRITQTELQLKNGSRIKALPSGSEGKSIRGFTADIVIEEEAGIISDEINNGVIIPMLASKKNEGQLIKIGTPLLKNHFYKSCFNDNEFEVINVTWKDCVNCGQYSQEFVDEQRRNITDIEFQTEYEANFVEDIMSFFPSPLIISCLEPYKFVEI